MVKEGETVVVQLSPAPRFSGGGGQPSTATIYGSHYDRLCAVLDAARTGNRLLLKLAVEYQDAHGSSDQR